jgi:hypothetical protein
MKKIFSVMLAVILMVSVFSFESIAAENKRGESKTRTVAKIGLGTALGAGVGALIGGKRGAAAGALIGGGAMTAHSLAKRDSGQSRKTRTISTIAAGSLIGTGIGAAIGGKKGAGIGALIGGGSSTVYALTRKDLKEPKPNLNSYQTSQNNYSSSLASRDLTQSKQINLSNNTLATKNNDDPYRRLSGPQGALVGNFLANGSRACTQLNAY